MRLVLASSSPRRARLLTEAGYSYETKAADVDERSPRGKKPVEAAVEIARRKAKATDAPDAWVLAADTIVEHDGHILGKPQDEVEAHAMLRMLSGHTHTVITGVVIRPPKGEMIAGYERTVVAFRDLTDEEIDAYVRTGEPMDKAGAYGIQGKAKAFVTRIEGPMDNVVGLPMTLVAKLLADAGFKK